MRQLDKGKNLNKTRLKWNKNRIMKLLKLSRTCEGRTSVRMEYGQILNASSQDSSDEGEKFQVLWDGFFTLLQEKLHQDL